MHVMIVAVALKVCHLPPAKNEIVWVSLSNIALQVTESAVASQKQKPEQLQPVQKVLPPLEPEVTPNNVEKRQEPEQQPVEQNSTIEPKVSQPKPPPPLKIQKTHKIKQKFSKPTDSANTALLEKQQIKATTSPMPAASPENNTFPLKLNKLLKQLKTNICKPILMEFAARSATTFNIPPWRVDRGGMGRCR